MKKNEIDAFINGDILASYDGEVYYFDRLRANTDPAGPKTVIMRSVNVHDYRHDVSLKELESDSYRAVGQAPEDEPADAELYVGQLYWFVHDLTVVARSEEEARKALLKEFVKAYREIEETDPTETIMEDGRTALDAAKAYIQVFPTSIGKVLWL